MVKVQDKIKVYRNERSIEVNALFDTGSGGSYLSDRVSDKLGYEEYPEPLHVPLAVKGKEAEVIGRLHAYVEVVGCKLPEEETIGVVRNLYVDAIIGLNLIEKYGIVLEKEKISFREYPPRAFLL